jgi:hypothetical protein
MRFRVESWSHPQRPHTVDLLAFNGLGECSCADWSIRRAKAAKLGLKGQESQCRHITATRNYFLNKLLEQMARDHR